MNLMLFRSSRWAAAALVLTLLAACASPGPAPVESRTPVLRAELPGTAPAARPAPAPARAAPEVVARPGEFVVRPGDTLIRIGLETGQGWRDIARWNQIEDPNRIEVGQVLRVVPPAGEATAVAVRPPGEAELRPIEPRAAAAPGAAAPALAVTPPTGAVASPVGPAAATPATPAPVAPAAGAGGGAAVPAPQGPAGSPAAVAPPAPAAAPAAPRASDDDIVWAWPAPGPVAVPFDGTRSNGLVITGRAGEPVLAAADGRVVYAGSGLRGFGNLVIIRHNNNFLSAYAHNQALLVREDQVVRRGQRIAEMGSTEAERVQLHFEIRRHGRPVDPARLLPPR
jgi:lipoprotein NlpD